MIHLHCGGVVTKFSEYHLSLNCVGDNSILMLLPYSSRCGPVYLNALSHARNDLQSNQLRNVMQVTTFNLRNPNVHASNDLQSLSCNSVTLRPLASQTEITK